MTTIELAHPSTDPVAVPVRWDRRKGAILLGVPAAWAVLLFLHPTGDGNLVYPVINERAAGPLAGGPRGHGHLHPAVRLRGLDAHRGVENVAARTARVLLPVGAVVYGLFEGMLGVGTHTLVGHVQDLPAHDQAVGATLVEDFFMRTPIFRLFEYGGTLALGGGIIAAAIALRRPGRRPLPAVGLLVVSAPLITAHVPPFGPVGLACFVLAVVLSRRSLLHNVLLGDIGVATASATNVAAPKPHSLAVRYRPSRRLGGHDECKQSSPRTDTLPAAEE